MRQKLFQINKSTFKANRHLLDWALLLSNGSGAVCWCINGLAFACCMVDLGNTEGKLLRGRLNPAAFLGLTLLFCM